MIPLRRLLPGDRVALVAPASPFAKDELDAGVAEIRRLGFDAVYDESLFARDGFMAGTPDVRTQAIHQAWNDPSVAALIAMRGGYGSAHLLPLLDPVLMVRARKALIGYSDITALLLFYLQHGLAAIHGPMIERRLAAGPSAYDQGSFLRVMTGVGPAGVMQPETVEVLHEGEAAGTLVGGTLTQMASLLGTPWGFAVPDGAVVFLEDIGERPFRIHRLLTQLTQAGVFARARAIVFGEFPGCDEPGGRIAIRDVLREFTAGFHGPVLFGFPSGHTAGPAWTLPFGVQARVVSGPAPMIDILEAAVSA